MKIIKHPLFIFGLIFFLSEIFVIYSAINTAERYERFKEIGLDTNAYIKNIDVEINRTATGKKKKTNTKTYYADIEYIVNDETYTHRITVASTAKVGNVIPIKYDPEYPDSMMLASSDKDSTILVIIGSIFALVGTGIDVLFVKSELRKKKLKETGKKYISKISKLNVNENLKDNDGIHPCDVELEYIDSNGITQKINIKQVYRKLNENSQINIYVDKENKDNYLIDWETSQL